MKTLGHSTRRRRLCFDPCTILDGMLFLALPLIFLFSLFFLVFSFVHFFFLFVFFFVVFFLMCYIFYKWPIFILSLYYLLSVTCWLPWTSRWILQIWDMSLFHDTTWSLFLFHDNKAWHFFLLEANRHQILLCIA